VKVAGVVTLKIAMLTGFALSAFISAAQDPEIPYSVEEAH